MKKFILFLLLISFRAPIFGACELYDLEITRSDCDANRQFYVTINFQYHDVSECFTIKGNGKNYGTFRYSQLPVTLGPFEGDCHTIYEFVIRDCHNERCSISGALDVVCCEEHCELGELRIEKTNCDSNGNFCAVLNFNHKGNSKCFNVYGNGKHYGRFSYSQLPLKICGLKGDCETEFEFEVRDCEDPECSTAGSLGVVCCEPPCHLYDLRLERTDCDSHGRFFVYLNFHYTGTSRCFVVHGNGKTFGPFNYSQLPVKLGPFDGDCTTVYEFSVVDCDNKECKVSKELGKVCCEKPHCEIKNLRIERTRCDSHNNFFVIIRFQYSGTSHCFKVRGNGRNYGTFQYSQLPITIGPLKGDCRTHYEFVVEDCEYKECKASKALGIVCCEWKREREDDESLRKMDQIRASENLESQNNRTAGPDPQPVAWRITQNHLELNLESLDEIECDIRIYHLSGQLLYQYSGSGSGRALQIPIASWAPGLYFIKFRTGSGSSVYRFFK